MSSPVRTVDDLLQLTPTPSSQWNDAEYAVYLYTPNRETLERSEWETRKPGAGFSLSLVGSSISLDREPLLREQVATKMSQGSLYSGSGQVTTLDPGVFPPHSQSYFSLVEAGPTGSTGQSGSSDEQRRQFLVCFASIGKGGLDLFRTELDSYCGTLKPLLHQLPREDLSTAFPGSELEQWIKLWFSENVLYLVRVIQICQNQLPTLLHMAVNSKVEVTGETEAVRYVKQFLEACSLANLMQFSGTKESGEGELISLGDVSPCRSQSAVVQVSVTQEGCTVSSEASSKFCSNWAQVLLAQGTSSPDPFFLRQAVENYKLKIIQDVNALKRLLRHAESDYHALYRCYVFLCACGNGELLLQCAAQEARALPSPETLSVLEAIQTYADKCGFIDVRTH